MSAGRFVRTRYEAVYDNTQVHPIRVQPETLDLELGGVANAGSENASTTPISAVVSRNKRARGLRPALVSLQWTGSSPSPAGNVGITTIPLLNPDIRAIAAVADSDTEVSYLGVATWTVAGYTAEEAK